MLREPAREVQPPEMDKAACMGAQLHCNDQDGQWAAPLSARIAGQ